MTKKVGFVLNIDVTVPEFGAGYAVAKVKYLEEKELPVGGGRDGFHNDPTTRMRF